MDFSHIFSDLVLTLVFVLLLAMSFASWYLIFWKGLILHKEFKLYDKFRHEKMDGKDWPKRLDYVGCEGSINPILQEVKNLENVLKNYDASAKKEILSMHLVQVLDEARLNLDKGLTLLASIGSSAPFIGLFGTVWGIYNALSNIASQGSAGLSVVAGPMGEALVATAFGLFAAIPAVLAYNSFVRLNRILIQNLRHISEQITIYLSN